MPATSKRSKQEGVSESQAEATKATARTRQLRCVVFEPPVGMVWMRPIGMGGDTAEGTPAAPANSSRSGVRE